MSRNLLSVSSKPRIARIAIVVLLTSAITLMFALPAASAGSKGVREPLVESVPKDDPRSIDAQRLASAERSVGTAAGPVWYLAEGSNSWGFTTEICIENPNEGPVTIRVTYMTTDGPVVKPDITLAGASVLVIDTIDHLGLLDFSTKVECLEGLAIAVDRYLFWEGGPYGMTPAAHYSIGITSPEYEWYLAEGSTGGDFETYVLVQNPSNRAIQVDVLFQDLLGPAGGVTLNMAPNSRQTVDVADFVPDTWSVSTWVSSLDEPIIAERAMYWNQRGGGHDSIGTARPGTSWLLAEGCTGGDFETWVLVQNPNAYSVIANYDYVTPEGLWEGGSVELDAFSRSTVCVNEQMPGEWEISTLVTSADPVIAERAMYGNGRLWGHDSIGMEAAHDILMMPGGGTFNNWETWVLVMNPFDTAAEIDVWYLTEADAPENYFFSDTVPAFTRYTYDMGSIIGDDNVAGTFIFCNTIGVKVVAEQAIYWSDDYGIRCAAGDTIGGYLDVE